MYNKFPLSSPASLLGYSIVMLTGMLFFSDARLAPFPSPSALHILNDHLLDIMFSQLLDLPVPPFMANELEAIRPLLGDLAVNIAFFPSLASSNFLIDFGRMILANTFFMLHNLMATMPGNSTTASLMEAFYKGIIVQLTDQNTTYTITPAQLFGHIREHDNAATRYANWLNTRVNLLVNALAIRPINAMSIPGHLPITHPAYVSLQDFNPYLMCIGYAPGNADSLIQIFRSLGQFVTEVFPTARPLRAYTQPGTQEIARYLGFSAPVPTWHSDATGLAADADQSRLFAPTAPARTHAQFANDITFLGALGDPVAPPTATNDSYEMQTFPCPADATGYSVQLVEPEAPPANAPDPIGFMANTSNLSGPTPHCIIFDPSSNTTTHLGVVIISGKIIEHGDIDCTTQVLENPATPLFQQNGILVGGLIPFSQVRNGLTDPTTFLLNRATYGDNNFPITIFRGRTWQIGYHPTDMVSFVVPPLVRSQTVDPFFRDSLSSDTLDAPPSLQTYPPAISATHSLTPLVTPFACGLHTALLTRRPQVPKPGT